MKNKHARYLKLVLLPALLLNIAMYCIALVVLQPQSVFAHAFVIGSDPVDGSTVAAIPKVIRIYFDADISSLSTTQVLYVQNSDFVTLQSHSALTPNTRRELDTYLPANASTGSYLVRWTAVANEDGHTTFGSIGFDVGHSSLGLPGTPTLGPTSSNCVADTCDNDIRRLDLLGILAVAWEWLVMAALVLWVAILVMERVIFARVEPVTDLLDRARRQSVPLQWLCLSALLVGECVTLALRSLHISRAMENGTLDFSDLPGLLLHTWYGQVWMMRLLLLVLALLLLWWMTKSKEDQEAKPTAQRLTPQVLLPQGRTGPLRLQPAGAVTATTGTIKAIPTVLPNTTTAPLQRYSRWWFLLAGLLLCSYAVTDTVISPIQPHLSAVVISALSLLAQSIWFGGLAYLGFIVLPLLSSVDLDSNTGTIIGLLKRMTPFMLGAIGVQCVALLFISETTLTTPSLLLDDSYGRSLLVRILLTALTAFVSLYILFVIRPKLARQTSLLPVVNSELPARRTRQSALERTTRQLPALLNFHAFLSGGVLLCTALMGFYAPPIVYPNISYTNPVGVTTTPTSTNAQGQIQHVGSYTIGLQVSPGRVTSTNTVTVSITDANGKAVSNAKVEVITNMQGMDMGTAIQNGKAQGAVYVASFAPGQSFSMSSTWNVEIHFQVPGQSVQKAVFQVVITG